MPKRFEIEAIFRAIDRVSRPISRMQARVGRFTRSMERGLRRVDRVLTSVTRGLARGFRTAVVGATVAVTGLFLATNKLADDLDNLAKQSKRLEFPIEDLQEWQFAAEQSGVESEVFLKSIDKFAKSLGEAKAGFGTLKTGLDKIDKPLLKQLKNTDDISEAFDIYVKAMRNTKGAAEKAALGVMAFGRAGGKMVTLANASEEELAKLRAEMRANGVATLAQAEAAEEYNDSMNSLKLAVGGFIRGVLTPLLPLLSEGARWLREWAIENREIISSKILQWGKEVVKNWRNIVDWAKKIGKGVMVFFALVGVLKILIGVLTVVNALMMANPIGLIVAGIAIIVAAVTAAVVFADELKAAFDSLPQPVKVLLAVLLPIMGPLAWMIAAAVWIKTNWSTLKPFFINLGKTITKVFERIKEGLKNAAVSIVNAWIIVKNFFVDLWNGILDVFETVVNFLMTTGPISWFIAAVALIKQNWEPITEVFKVLWDSIVANFMTPIRMIKAAVASIVGFFRNVWNQAMGVADTAVEKAKSTGAFAKIIKAVSVIKEAWGGLKTFFKGIWDGVVAVVSAAVDKLRTLMHPVLSVLGSLRDAKNELIGSEIGFMNTSGARGDLDEDVAERGDGFTPNVVSPEERLSRSIEEKTESSKAELTIKDETGRGEVTKGSLGPGLTLIPTGGF